MRTSLIGPAPCRPSELALAPGNPPARGRPPAWEGLSPNGRLEGLSPEARERVHRANVRTRWHDVDRYEEYLERYLEGARRCRTPEELRSYGPPAIAGEGLEGDGTGPERLEMARGPTWALKCRLGRANRDLGDLVLRLERRPVPLDVFFDLSIAARVEAGGRSIGGSLSARGGGTVEAGAAGVAGGTAGQGRHEVGLDAGLAGAKATFSGGRIVGAEVSVRPVPGVTVHSKRTRGAIEHGLAVGATIGGGSGKPGVKVEARATVGLNLTTAEFVRRGLYGSFFDEGRSSRSAATGREEEGT